MSMLQPLYVYNMHYKLHCWYSCYLPYGGGLADCGEPESPENGMISFVRTVEGSVANYTCDEGYTLDGVTQRVCGEDGQWTGDVPLCQSKLRIIFTKVY